MALQTLTLSNTTGVQGRPFKARIYGRSPGSTISFDETASPGWSEVNGFLSNQSLPMDVSTVAIRETLPGTGTQVTRIDVTAMTAVEVERVAKASLPAGRSLVRYTAIAVEMPSGDLEYRVQAEDDFGNTRTMAAIPQFDAQALSVVSAMTTVPPPTRQALINNTVRSLKAAGLWDKLDIFYQLDAHDKQAAMLNWKAPASYTLSEAGTTTGRFTADRGFTGNGTDYSLNTGYNPAANGQALTLNSASIGVVAHTPGNATAFEIGNTQLRLAVRSGTTASGRVNSGTTTAIPAVPSAIGFTVLQRRDAANQLGSKDGAASESLAAASLSITSAPIMLLGNIATSYSSRGIGAAFAGGGLGESELAAFNGILVDWQKSVGAYRLANTGGPALFSTDTTTYGTMTSQQIPSITSFRGRRIIRANYGGNVNTGIPLGANGEGSGAFVRVSATDDAGATFTHGGFFVPAIPASESVIDPHPQRLNDGRCLLLYPYNGSGERSIWGVILNNPTAAPAQWSFTVPAFLAYGFTGRPRYRADRRSLRYVASQPLIGLAPPYATLSAGMRYCALTVLDNAVRSDELSTIPEPTVAFTGSISGNTLTVTAVAPGQDVLRANVAIAGAGIAAGTLITAAAAGGGVGTYTINNSQTVASGAMTAYLSDYQEVSVMELNNGGTRAVMRTAGRLHYSDNPGDGLAGQWPKPVPIMSVPSTSSRADLARSPTGRPVLAYNDSLNKRERMAVAIWSNDDITAMPFKYVFDLRGADNPRVSYPSVSFEMDADGGYTGWILVAYDCGRGRQDSPTNTNELVIERINERSVINGAPVSTRTTASN